VNGPRANFRIGEAFPADDTDAVFVVGLAVAIHDMRLNYDLIRRDEVSAPSRLWLSRLMIAQIREATLLLAPPERASLPLERFLDAHIGAHPKEVREVRDAIAELTAVMRSPWTYGGTVGAEFKRIRNGVFHYGHNKEGRDQLAQALMGAAGRSGSIIISDDATPSVGSYPHRVVQQMAFPGTEDQEAVQRLTDLLDSIGAAVGALRRVAERVEGLWITTRRPGVVTLTYPDGRFEPHHGRGLNPDS
jgi:hypothetical protein